MNRQLSSPTNNEQLMKRLYVLRHAKSSWDDARLDDFDRPLNDRGEQAAPMMGRVMRDNGFEPDAIVASPATRAKTTAKLAASGGKFKAEVRFDERIYEAGVQTLIDVISETDGTAGSLMIVGHNPGIEGIIRQLTGKSTAMPTAALAVIDLDVDDWGDAEPGCGTLIDVLRPKEIAD
jgi:phosphohistidine phosphatase